MPESGGKVWPQVVRPPAARGRGGGRALELVAAPPGSPGPPGDCFGPAGPPAGASRAAAPAAAAPARPGPAPGPEPRSRCSRRPRAPASRCGRFDTQRSIRGAGAGAGARAAGWGRALVAPATAALIRAWVAVRGARRPGRREGRGRSAGPLGLTLSLPFPPSPASPRRAPALTPAGPQRKPGQLLHSALRSLAKIPPLQGPPLHLRPWTSRRSTALEAPLGRTPFPTEVIMGVQLHPRGMVVRNTHARASTNPGALPYTVTRIVFASSSRKSPRPTPTHPASAGANTWCSESPGGRDVVVCGWQGREVRGPLARISGL